MRWDVVRAAAGWIGTPYRHQATLKGYGSDCLGLVRGVWREVTGSEPETPPPYSPDWSEAEQEERLWEAVQRHLREVARAPQPGDVALFRMRSGHVAKHVGIISAVGPAPLFIHAYQRHGVIESPFSAPWQRRVVSYFEFPEPKRR